VNIPKGFFPIQDTGTIVGITEGAQDISFKEMAKRQMAINDVIKADPYVDAFSCTIGAGVGGQTGNNGRCYIALKPFEERSLTATEVIAELRPKLAGVEGANTYLQAAQDISVGGRLSRTMYQYTLQDPNLDELNSWAPRVLQKPKNAP
jgi:multidrug efflux pump subunit AcrB